MDTEIAQCYKSEFVYRTHLNPSAYVYKSSAPETPLKRKLKVGFSTQVFL